jgi:hypothetical protein
MSRFGSASTFGPEIMTEYVRAHGTEEWHHWLGAGAEILEPGFPDMTLAGRFGSTFDRFRYQISIGMSFTI